MIGNLLIIIGGYLYATFCEWWLHKHVLHGLGKNKNSYFSFHWHLHHKECRRNGGKDTSYTQMLKHPIMRRELTSLGAILILHAPIYYLSPLFYATLVVCAARYYYIHMRSHIDIEWAKAKVPHHWEHHMGKDQDANWGITTDFWDRLLRTRKKYIKK